METDWHPYSYICVQQAQDVYVQDAPKTPFYGLRNVGTFKSVGIIEVSAFQGCPKGGVPL